MDRYLRAVAVCLAVLLTYNGASAQGKTADEIADDHACTFFRATDSNKDKVATLMDYIFKWTTVPISGSQFQPTIDLKRQVKILNESINVFPLTDVNNPQSLLKGGVTLGDFTETIRKKQETPLLRQQLDDLVTFIMKVFNFDGDEQSLTQNELQTYSTVVRQDDVQTTFTNLDKDNNSLVSHAEYYEAGVAFFNGVEDGRCEWFAGPPKTCDEVRAEKSRWLDLIASGEVSLTVPAVGSIGDVDVLTKLLGTYPELQASLKKIFEQFFGQIPAVLSSLVGLVSTVLGTLNSVLTGQGK